MIKPILACIDPYKTAEEFTAVGWNIDFSQPWDDKAFEVRIGGYQFMIAAVKETEL